MSLRAPFSFVPPSQFVSALFDRFQIPEIDMQYKKTLFSLCIKAQPIFALFGHMKGCVPQAEVRYIHAQVMVVRLRVAAVRQNRPMTQRSGGGAERRRGKMSEFCRLRRSGGYGARVDENRGDDFSAG